MHPHHRPRPRPRPHADLPLLTQQPTAKGVSHDGEEINWLARAASSSKGLSRNCETGLNDDPLGPVAVPTASASGGNAADSGEPAASADWISAAVVSSSKGSSKAKSAQATTTCGGASASEGWLASSIASGKLVNHGNDDDNPEVPGDSMRNAAAQTDNVTITVATTVEETSEKPKPRLPPWAKPWRPAAPATAADARTNSSTPTHGDDHQKPSVDKDSPNTDGLSPRECGGLDWVNAAVAGEQETSAPISSKHCGRSWYGPIAKRPCSI